MIAAHTKIEIRKKRRAISASVKIATAPTTRALDGAEAAVGFDLDGSAAGSAEGHSVSWKILATPAFAAFVSLNFPPTIIRLPAELIATEKKASSAARPDCAVPT